MKTVRTELWDRQTPINGTSVETLLSEWGDEPKVLVFVDEKLTFVENGNWKSVEEWQQYHQEQYDTNEAIEREYNENQQQLLTNVSGSKTDIDFLANAIFAIDETLSTLTPPQQEEVEARIKENPTLRAFARDSRAGYMVDLWVRWISTGRKTIDECPEQYFDAVAEKISIIPEHQI